MWNNSQNLAEVETVSQQNNILSKIKEKFPRIWLNKKDQCIEGWLTF